MSGTLGWLLVLTFLLGTIWASEAASWMSHEQVRELSQLFDVDVSGLRDELEKADIFFNKNQQKAVDPRTIRRNLLFGSHNIERSQPLLADFFGGDPGFYHSVASGDPIPDGVVIW